MSNVDSQNYIAPNKKTDLYELKNAHTNILTPLQINNYYKHRFPFRSWNFGRLRIIVKFTNS